MAEPKRQNLKVVDDDGASRGADVGSGQPSKVAAELCAARTQAGIDLHDAAETLRIRYHYLKAIEEGRFGDLPGPSYALGFVRTYAEFLDLDGKEIVRRFKEEGQGLSRRQALVFPEPLQEGRFPGGRVLVTAVVLAGAIYGGWYYWQHRHANRAEKVSPVPANLAALVQSKPQPIPGPVAAVPATTPSGMPNTTPPAAQTSSPSGGAAANGDTASGAGSPSKPTGDAASPAATTPSSTAKSETSTIQSQPEAKLGTGVPDTASPGPTPARTPAPASRSVETTASGDATQPAIPPAPVEHPAETASKAVSSASEQIASTPNARVYGETNGGSRVTLSAAQDSWLQVRDENGTVIWTRILRAGDSYRVPNQAGLTLVTGNAGALEIMVDGKTAPPLGPIGAVRRNISLDPDKLAAGTAIGQ